MCKGHDHSSPGTEGQGQKSRSNVLSCVITCYYDMRMDDRILTKQLAILHFSCFITCFMLKSAYIYERVSSSNKSVRQTERQST